MGLGTFVKHNKATLHSIVDEAEAIVASGATGAQTDAARKNYFLATAILAILDHVLTAEKPQDNRTPGPAPAKKPAVKKAAPAE